MSSQALAEIRFEVTTGGVGRDMDVEIEVRDDKGNLLKNLADPQWPLTLHWRFVAMVGTQVSVSVGSVERGTVRIFHAIPPVEHFTASGNGGDKVTITADKTYIHHIVVEAAGLSEVLSPS